MPLAVGYTLQPSPHFAKFFTVWELGDNNKIEGRQSRLRKWQIIPS